MKKIYNLILVVYVLVAGVASAATTPTSIYTPAQQACMKTASDKRASVLKISPDIMNSIKDALKTRNDAVAVAQKITDPKQRSAALKAAINAYNNNDAVKKAKSAVTSASVIKAANNQYLIDVKACIPVKNAAHKGFFQTIGEGIANFFSNMSKFLLGRK